MQRLLLLLAGLGALGLIFVFSDPGRARSAAFEIQRASHPSEVSWPPDQRPRWHEVDGPSELVPYRELAARLAGPGTTAERAIRLLAEVAELGTGPGLPERQTIPWIQTDEPLEVLTALQSGKEKGSCAHYTWTYTSLARAAGIEARIVGLEGDRWLDGDGHAMNEVYLPEAGTWAIMDAQNHVHFLDSEGAPLSLLGLRELLLAGRRDEVQVVQGAIRTGEKDADETLDYYADQILRVVYNAHDDLSVRYREIYENPLARAVALRRWPRLPRRLIENVVWDKDHRILFVDRPEIDVPFPSPWIFWISALLFGGALVALALSGLASRLQRRPT